MTVVAGLLAVAAMGPGHSAVADSGLPPVPRVVELPVAALVAAPTAIADAPGPGYWVAAGDGGVFAYDGAPFYGSAAGWWAADPVVDLAPTAAGYWLTTQRGAVVGFGSAGFYGSTSDMALNAPIVAIESAPDGRGYWLLGADGGVFSFGSARFWGAAATGAHHFVDLVTTADGAGYWLLDEAGALTPFGSAHALAGPSTQPGRAVGAGRQGPDEVVVAWSHGVIDERGRSHQSLAATLATAAVVDIALDGTTPVALTGDQPLRRIGPSVSHGTAQAALDFAQQSAAHTGVVSFYADFAANPEFPWQAVEDIHRQGAVPFITWEPWDHLGDLRDQPHYRLRAIIEGRHDALIDRWAAAVARFEHPVMIRWGHEMNGDWYPWSEDVNGNQPGDYVEAWRHVHRRFEHAEAHNVRWVWNPNVETPTSIDLNRLYPGPDYVDYVALDGYNAGSALPWGGWRPGASILGPAMADLKATAPGVRVIVGETASTEAGGDKAHWVRELFAWLDDEHPDIDMVLWFNESKETSWAVDSSAEAQRAFRVWGTERWCGCAVGANSPS